MKQLEKRSAQCLENVRNTRPLVHSITNYVVMNSTANVLLAMGASPIMAHAIEEIEEIIALVNSVVLNIGTLSNNWIDSMLHAASTAKQKSKPLVLDPVGAGATKMRTEAAWNIMRTAVPSVIRGNASEILALAHSGARTRGVDSAHLSTDALDSAKSLAASLGTIVAVTGKIDFVTDGNRTLQVTNGHEMLSMVTGTGCAATVTIAAFISSSEDPLIATAAALAFFGLAGEIAAEKSQGPGSFWVNMLDMLYGIDPKKFETGARISAL